MFTTYNRGKQWRQAKGEESRKVLLFLTPVCGVSFHSQYKHKTEKTPFQTNKMRFLDAKMRA